MIRKMVYFPARKCYHAAKIGLLLILVVTLLTLFEQWRGGKRSAGATFSDPIEAEYERQILQDEARIIPGLGEGGVAAHLVGEDKRLGEESEKKLAMNVYLSDRISYNRTLKDARNPACARVIYDAELPSASVIIIFHNEPESVVLRTVWSVVNSVRRTNEWFSKANFVERGTGKIMTLGSPGQDPSCPFVYLKEIILVDDNSTLPELKGKMSHYVRTRFPPDLIRILRLPDRVGLTRARLAGARYAVGDALVFLDAHCEVQRDWLRPLLHELKLRPHAALVPIIDVIDSSNFYYSVQDPASFQVGGFTFTGHFTWIDVPEREKKRRGSDIAPTWSPTMAGGLFAINREYYWELGAYDEQMAGWGGENLEMSFRIWQCGGTLETIPCSRVGHVFRSFHPYGLPANSDTHGINTARMAEVWMDEYAELFYLHRPDLRNNPKIGDVTHRKILREKLQCKSFQWYLDNIYKEKFVPVRDVYGYGRFMNPASGLCLDTMQREGEAVPLGVYPCHPQLQATQYLSLSLAGHLRDEESCAHVPYARRDNQFEEEKSRKVLMSACHEKQRGQQWKYSAESGALRHVESGLCLAAAEPGADAAARRCTGGVDQRWTIDYAEYNHFKRNDVEPNDRDSKLQKLHGQRRISRSLLSYDSSEKNSIDSLRRKSHKKKHKHKRSKRTKNKFIVRLERARSNASEHLEVDIHCRHARLYPNNSFVRDLVSILNDNNIKVINNGRVFEKNKVTEVARAAHTDKVLNKLDIQGDAAHDAPVTKKHRSKKHKVQAVNMVGAAREARSDAPPPPREPHDKRIIIEDFVEVKPSTVASAKRFKKHKKSRSRSPAAPSPPPAPPAPPTPPAPSSGEGDAPLTMLSNHRAPRIDDLLKSDRESEETTPAPQDSVEDAAMLASGDEREESRTRDSSANTADETWPLGTSRFRSKEPLSPALRQGWRAHTPADQLQESLKSAVESGVEAARESPGSAGGARRGGAGAKPVRLVMRTNLTFNLGKEFFTRAQQLAQAHGGAEELVVPSEHRDVPPIDLLLAPRAHLPPATTTTTPAAPPRAQDSDSTLHSSSSSESSDDT